MKKIIYPILFLLLFVLLLFGYKAYFFPHKQIACNQPLKVIDGECCLDNNDNNICDSQESLVREANGNISTQVDDKNLAEDSTDKVDSDSSADLDFEQQCQPPLIAVENGCCPDLDNDGNCDEVDDISPCGDGICSQNEIDFCCLDCGCPNNQICIENECEAKLAISPGFFKDITEPKLPVSFCGDGICQAAETSDNCCSDCGCPAYLFCGSDNKCSAFKTPSFSLKPSFPLLSDQHAPVKDWIVVTLDKIEVHSSGDGKDPGELMFFSLSQSGHQKQYVKWPIGGEKAIWTGQTLLAGELEAVPLFALPEEEMGEKLDINLLFGESDLPSVLPYLNSDLDIGKVQYFFQFDNCRSGDNAPAWFKLMTETIFKPFMMLMDLINPRSCQKNDFFGRIHRVFYKTDWQIGRHKVDLNDITVFYSIRKISVNQQQIMKLRLSKVRIVDDGDKGDNPGEIVGWGRFSSGFVNNSFGIEFGENKQKVFDLGQYKVKSPTDLDVDLTSAVYSVTGQPFIYGELDLFDRDSDCYEADEIIFSCYQTSKLEEVGVTSLLFFPDNESGTYVINSGGVGQSTVTWEFNK